MPPAPAEDPLSLDTLVLIERHREGDRRALDELFRRYAERVRRIVAVRMGAFLRSRADVEDVVQETLLRAFKSLEGYESREDAKLIDWMARIAENALRNLYSHEHAQKRDAGQEVGLEGLRGSAPGESSLGWDLVAEATSIPDRVSRGEMEEVVDACLATMREEEREVILLADYAQGDWEFVARKLQRSTADAAQQFHRRARRTLSAKVERKLRRTP